MRTKSLGYFSLILVFNLVTIFSLFGQNRIDENGKKQGKWVKYKDSSKFYEGQFVDDIPHGEFRYFYPNGHLKIKTQYSDNGRINRTKIFFDSWKEKVQAEGKYFNRKKDSTWNYYNDAEYLIAIENYKNGLKHGEYKVFNHLGQLNLEEFYYYDTLTGTSIEYSENGTELRSITYQKGKRLGAFRVFYPEGNILLEGNYVYDIRDSIWTTYFKNGEIEFLDYYEKGHLLRRTNKDGKELDMKKDEETIPLNIDPSVFDSSAIKR